MKFIRPLILITVISIVSMMPISTHAFDINNPSDTVGTDSVCSSAQTGSSAYCADTANGGQNDIYGYYGLITDAINVISIIAGIASVVVLMIGGFRFITSGGEPNSINGARGMIIYAMVGIVIICAAQIIMRFVIAKL